MWPPEKPLTLPEGGTLLMDATPEEYEAVMEDRRRWTLANDWHRDIRGGRRTKGAVWAEIKNGAEAYRDDLVRRLKELESHG